MLQGLLLNGIILLVRRSIIIPLLVLFFLVLVTVGVVYYGKGYRFINDNGKPNFLGTGMLVATSLPDGAQVFIDGHLTTATDNTINLSPGEYTVKIQKEGYFSWTKKIIIKKEVVTKVEAKLFPSAPKLESITTGGVENPVMDPSQTKLAYTVASNSAVKKRGIYILDMSTRPILTLQNSATQIVDNSTNTFSNSLLSWSPDGIELLATISAGFNNIYLLEANRFNENPPDVSATMVAVNSSWEKQKMEKEKAQMETLSKKIRSTVAENFEILTWSASDEPKILYKAKNSFELAEVKKIIGGNTTPEERSIKKDAVYVYDILEDKNYKIFDSLDTNVSLTWFPESSHLVYVHNQKVEIMEYDGGNKTVVYAGPFEGNSVFPWPDGNKIVILTSLGNVNTPPNLYTVGLK